jgi:hypothetical protein
MQNAYIERFDGSVRRKLFDAHLFRSLVRVPKLMNDLMLDYNTQRPHQALTFMIPLEFKCTIQEIFAYILFILLAFWHWLLSTYRASVTVNCQ